MKKLLCLLLIAAMLLPLVACGGPAVTDGTGTGDAAYEDATYDFYTSKIGSSKWDGSLPLIPEGEAYTITVGLKPSSQVLDYETNDYILWLEEQTGVNIDIIEFAGSSSDVQTQLSLMLNGGEKVPDIMLGLISKTMACEFGCEGFLMNVTGYLQNEAYYTEKQLKMYYPDQEKYDLMMQNFWKTIGDPVSNQAFAFPTLYYSHCDNMAHQIMINRQWLDEGVDGTGKGMVGGDAKLKLLKYDTFHQTNNETWHTQYSMCAESYYQYYLDPADNPYGAAVYEDWTMCYDYYIEAGQPEQSFDIFYRTPEEDDRYQEYSSEINSYLTRSRADFIVGRRDIHDDAEWQAYLDDLDKLNIQENFIGVAAASWERTKAANAAKAAK